MPKRSDPKRRVQTAKARKQERGKRQATAVQLAKSLRVVLCKNWQQKYADDPDHTAYAKAVHGLALSTDTELIAQYYHARKGGPQPATDAPGEPAPSEDTNEAAAARPDAAMPAQEGSSALAAAGFGGDAEIDTDIDGR